MFHGVIQKITLAQFFETLCIYMGSIQYFVGPNDGNYFPFNIPYVTNMFTLNYFKVVLFNYLVVNYLKK